MSELEGKPTVMKYFAYGNIRNNMNTELPVLTTPGWNRPNMQQTAD